MFESIASFDIGSSQVKVALAKKGFKTFNITEVVSQDIDLSLPTYAEGLSAAIRTLLDRQPIGGHKVIVNFPMDQTIVRPLTFPFTDPEQIESAVPFEAQENIPFDMEELALSFQITDTDDTEGRVIAAAARKESIERFCTLLTEAGAAPSFLGSETNALHECYANFNAIENENAILVHVGHTKTVMNIIIAGQLSATRCVPSGTSPIVKRIAEITQSPADALSLFHKLKLSVNGVDPKLDLAKFKNTGITKPKIKSIFDTTLESMNTLCSQINLTIKSFIAERGATDFDRIILSGGGSHITGLTTLVHHETGIKTERIDFELAVGGAISYFNASDSRIHFPCTGSPKGESLHIGKKYRLAIFFGGAALLLIVINVLIGFIFSALEKSNYDVVLDNLFRKGFQNRPPQGDPLAEAEKIIAQEKKELASITAVIPSDDPLIGYLLDVTSQFTADPTFAVKNMVIDREFIRFDGDVGSGTAVDSFKNKLNESKKFESVTLNTSMSRKDLVNFNIVIKLKKTQAKTPGAAQ